MPDSSYLRIPWGWNETVNVSSQEISRSRRGERDDFVTVSQGSELRDHKTKEQKSSFPGSCPHPAHPLWSGPDCVHMSIAKLEKENWNRPVLISISCAAQGLCYCNKIPESANF